MSFLGKKKKKPLPQELKMIKWYVSLVFKLRRKSIVAGNKWLED